MKIIFLLMWLKVTSEDHDICNSSVLSVSVFLKLKPNIEHPAMVLILTDNEKTLSR